MRSLRIYFFSLMAVILAMAAGFLSGDNNPSALREEPVSVIVVLQKQVELRALNKSWEASRITRQARHEQIIRSLQATAQSTQASLLHYLQEQKSLGRVQDYQSFWIVNAVAVTATPQVIEEIAQHPEVAAVYKDEDIGPIEPIMPVEIKKVFDQKIGAEPGLKAIKADCLWAKGINGAGTLVCNLDTGVNGNHVALYSRWRGNNGATIRESWFDPYNNSSFPVDLFKNTHGTLTMGVMTGMIGADTVGVAFGAQWIAVSEGEEGGSLGDVSVKNFLASFQWIADPDGNPTTIDDVPDVVNGSFRLGAYTCIDFLWDVIDAVEAADVVAIFAAGNDGKSGPYTVGNPASRATTPVNTFAVGAVDANNLIADFSSRGPSNCDSVSIKPEVVAPGVRIRSLIGDEYGVASGTSLSAPHVSGAVALLRQINPDATVEEIKYALLNSAVDLGPEGEDNSYGMGIIDVNAAAKLLHHPIRPNLNISRFTLNGEYTHFVQKGRTTELVVYLINTGLTAQNITARLVTSDPYCQVSESTFNFGTMRQNEIINNAQNPLLVTVNQSAPEGHNIVFSLEITVNNGHYKKINRFLTVVNKRVSRASVEPLNVEFNLNKGEKTWSVVTLSNSGSNNLEYEVGEVSPSNASLHNVLRINKEPASRPPFEMSASNTFLAVIRDSVGDMPQAYNFDIAQVNVALVDTFLTFCRSTDSAEQVISDYFSSLFIETVLDSGNAFAPPASLRLISIFIDTDQDVLTGMYPPRMSGAPSSMTSLLDVGADFEIGGPSDNYCANKRIIAGILGKYNTEGKRDYEYGSATFTLGITSNKISVCIPLMLLNDNDGNMNIAVVGELITFDTTRREVSGVYLDLVPDVGHGLIGIDTTPIPWLTEAPGKGIVSPSGSSKDIYLVADAAHLDNFIYTSNIYISTNDPEQPLITIPVKVTVGNSKRPVIPEQFQLYQNYPNPFNSTTTIEYQLSEASRVTIEVFNLLGQKVKTLVDVDKIVGYHQIVWNGKDNLGKNVASGVYLCRMKIKDFVERKKLLLIR